MSNTATAADKQAAELEAAHHGRVIEAITARNGIHVFIIGNRYTGAAERIYVYVRDGEVTGAAIEPVDCKPSKLWDAVKALTLG